MNVTWVSFENGDRLVFDCLYLRFLASCTSCFRLESMYRMWIRDHRHRFNSEVSDELRRELHTALGTAKWQVGFCHPYFSIPFLELLIILRKLALILVSQRSR